ncbi:MAG: hypothetical protein IT475_05515 [Aquimonas sp.]|nr:hypothetical protein [Aquimonas sp.]
MNTIYQALVALTETSPGLFQAYKDDLYEIDRDILENEVVDGDIWLWVLKECGTWMTRLMHQRDVLDAIRSVSSPKERWFVIECAHGQTGKVTEIQRADVEAWRAEAIARERRRPTPRPQRRKYIADCVAEITEIPVPWHRDLIAVAGELAVGSAIHLVLAKATLEIRDARGKRLRTLVSPTYFANPVTYRLTRTSAQGHATIEPVVKAEAVAA